MLALIYILLTKKFNDSLLEIENITCDSSSPCYNLKSSKVK